MFSGRFIFIVSLNEAKATRFSEIDSLVMSLSSCWRQTDGGGGDKAPNLAGGGLLLGSVRERAVGVGPRHPMPIHQLLLRIKPCNKYVYPGVRSPELVS